MARAFDELESQERLSGRGVPPFYLRRPEASLEKNPGEEPYDRLPPSLNRPMAAQAAPEPAPFTLPPGAQLLPEESAPFTLPPGAKLLPPPEAGLPEDPHERAALRTSRSVLGRGTPGKATEFISETVPGAIGTAVKSTAESMNRAVQSGGEDTGAVLEGALMGNPASVAYRTGMGIAKGALTPLERAQRETGVMSIPRAAESGPLGQEIATRFGATPKMAQRATSEVEAAVAGAPARAAGAEVSEATAGDVVRAAVEAAGSKAHPRLTLLIDRRLPGGEDVIDYMAKLARTGGKDDIAALAQLGTLVPRAERAGVQGALVQRLGRSSDGAFAPSAFVDNYSGLSNNMKNVLFGRGGEGSLRYHLDSIEAVARRAPSWAHLEQKQSGWGAAAVAAGASAPFTGAIGPLAVLGTAIPAAAIGRYLGKPLTAAPIAQWSRAYERVMRTNGAPNAIAAFAIATRNLNNTLGTDVDPRAVLGGQNGQPVAP